MAIISMIPKKALPGVAAVIPKPKAPTAAIPSATQAYFDKNYGGGDKYAADQQKRYTDAYNSGDTGLADRLMADSKRVGYSLTAPVNSGVPAQTATTPQNTPQQTSYQSGYTGPDISGMTQQLKDIYANRQASELQKLRDARDTALQGYNSQETTAKQGAYDSRNQADTTNLQNAQALREQMANGGLVGDGQNLTLQAGLNAQRLGALGAINRQENNAMQDIGQKRSLLQNNAAANELGLTQQINSDQAAALYDLAKYGDTRNFDVDNVNYGRYRDDVNQQFAQDQFDYGKTQDKIQNDANYAGTYGGNMTVGQRQQVADNKFRLGMATGTLSNGQQTLDNRQFQEGIRQDNRNYDRGVLESNRGYDRGVLESDRNFNQGVTESDRNYGLQQDQNTLDADKFKYGQLQDQAEADAGTKATPAQVKQILQNYQLTGQDPNGKAYKYNPGKGTPARKDWVNNTVQSMVNAGYDNGTIEQVLRSAGVTSNEEDEIFGGK